MKGKAGQYIFLMSVVLLVINDWLLKPTFHNMLTGKLSDIAGLFALPFCLTLLFPHRKLAMHVLSTFLFIIWNSPVSEPLIFAVNLVGIPIMRTVDYTDNFALLSVVLSFWLSGRPIILFSKPTLHKGFLFISFIALTATSLPPGELKKFVDINKTYNFNISKRQLVSELNRIQLKELQRDGLKGRVNFNANTNTFHYINTTDTLALLLDYTKIGDTDTIKFRTSYVEIMISGNDSTSNLKLVSTYQFVSFIRKKDYRKMATKGFEKRFVKKVKELYVPE